jgi:hypothetical protein
MNFIQGAPTATDSMWFLPPGFVRPSWGFTRYDETTQEEIKIKNCLRNFKTSKYV